MSNTITGSHYEQHSKESYESAYFYSPGAYMDHLRGLVVQTLHLDKDPTVSRRLLDIGGGTGNFTRMLLTANPSLNAVVVDPFLADDDVDDDVGSTGNNNPKRLQFVQATAGAFCEEALSDVWWRRDYHYILLKEVVHHLDDRVTVFRGMRDGFVASRNAGVSSGESHPHVLIITRPQIEIDYPLWPAARDVWASHQPSHEVLTQELYDAGFTRVEYARHAYPCQISLTQWQAMVKRRFWSTFSNFTDEELEQACRNMVTLHANRLDDQGNLKFEDRLVFLTAWK